MFEADIGRGADWPTAASTVGPISLYFLGEKIKKNGEAWLQMASGLKRLVSKHRPTRIDEKAALLIVLERLTDQVIAITQAEISVQVITQVTIPHGTRTLDRRAEAVYVVTVGLDGKSYLFAVESNGDVALSKHFAEPRLR